MPVSSRNRHYYAFYMETNTICHVTTTEKEPGCHHIYDYCSYKSTTIVDFTCDNQPGINTKNQQPYGWFTFCTHLAL